MNKNFWNKEYKNGGHLKLSTEPSGDMITFAHWAERNSEWPPFPKDGFILDVGCGNGRNIVALAREAHMRGYGFDTSGEAISQAKHLAETSFSESYNKPDFPLRFEVRGAEEKILLEDESVDVVLDMMSSHFLDQKQRENYLKEVVRVLKPYGWMFFKSFLLEGDHNAHRMIEQYPSGEQNTYIHPRIGVAEHVWTESELGEFFGPYFKIYKMVKSYKHIMDGKPWKRRTISLYLERKREF